MLNATYSPVRAGTLLALAAVLTAVLAGCGGHAALTFTAPPMPQQGASPLEPFYVATQNYFILYTPETSPFNANSQFDNGHYPVPMNYAASVQPPDGLDIALESERAIQRWHDADPRISIVSGVGASQERVHISLVDRIEYQGISNIIGLTRLVSGGKDPYYDVAVTTLDPLTGGAMSTVDITRTLTHELGHVFGLGHSPDQRDLMYYKSNSQQGQTPRAFLTLGDALTIWSTFNNRRINWDPSRPPIAYTRAGTRIEQIPATATATGEVICVYTKP